MIICRYEYCCNVSSKRYKPEKTTKNYNMPHCHKGQGMKYEHCVFVIHRELIIDTLLKIWLLKCILKCITKTNILAFYEREINPSSVSILILPA